MKHYCILVILKDIKHYYYIIIVLTYMKHYYIIVELTYTYCSPFVDFLALHGLA